MCDEPQTESYEVERKCTSREHVSLRGCLTVMALSCAIGLAGGTAGLALGADSGTPSASTTAESGAGVNDPAHWVGRNISAVVEVFGQPTYWNSNHDGGGGGNRYIYSNPDQPHFVFETEPGQIIVKAVRIP